MYQLKNDLNYTVHFHGFFLLTYYKLAIELPKAQAKIHVSQKLSLNTVLIQNFSLLPHSSISPHQTEKGLVCLFTCSIFSRDF